MKTRRTLLIGIALLCLTAATAKANVYATSIKLNGGTNNVALSGGGNLQVSYILNEAATAGVTIDIYSGGTVIRTISIPSGNPGTTRGANTVIWDGKNGSGVTPPGGTYSVRVNAAATGYPTWTQITDDTQTNSYFVYTPTCIDVDKNTNSVYYGRVIVGNGDNNPHPVGTLGDNLGILKFNADGSAPDDGIFSTGGFAWTDKTSQSPWKLRISADDKVYVEDFSGYGDIYSWDPTITTNAYSHVMRPDNDGPGNFSGIGLQGTGINTVVYSCDIRVYTGELVSQGVLAWHVSGDGTFAASDVGTVVIPAGAGSDLDSPDDFALPYGVTVDRNNRLYVIQTIGPADTASPALLRFPAYSGTPMTHADWAVGTNNPQMLYATGVAVDPTATYVAVSFAGSANWGGDGPGSGNTGGNSTIFDANTGTVVTNIVSDDANDHFDVAWDNAGNLYDTDNAGSHWRVYSPPGANQATTVALESVTIVSLAATSWSANQFHLTLTGQANQSYIIQSKTNLSSVNWIPVLTNNAGTAIRNLTLPTTTSQTFYRATLGQ